MIIFFCIYFYIFTFCTSLLYADANSAVEEIVKQTEGRLRGIDQEAIFNEVMNQFQVPLQEANHQASINMDDMKMNDIKKKLDRNTQTKREGNFYIFISFSMGESAISQIIQDASKSGGVVVLRGLRNNSMKETVSFISRFNEASLIIDPLLFRKYGIKKVPSFVVQKANSGEYNSLFGLVTVNYALSKLQS